METKRLGGLSRAATSHNKPSPRLHYGTSGFLEPWMDGSPARRVRSRPTVAMASSSRPSTSRTRRSSSSMQAGSNSVSRMTGPSGSRTMMSGRLPSWSVSAAVDRPERCRRSRARVSLMMLSWLRSLVGEVVMVGGSHLGRIGVSSSL